MTSQDRDSSAHEQRLAHQQRIAGRRRARRLALQGLYAMEIGERSAAEVSAEFEAQQDFAKADTAYFRRILLSVEASRSEIDSVLSPYLDRHISALTPVELGILRMALFELREQIDVPFKAVINEAVNLAAKFGADQSFKFINGVLDRAARDIRVHEQGRRAATRKEPVSKAVAEPDKSESDASELASREVDVVKAKAAPSEPESAALASTEAPE